jgi:hypothetical protein
MDTSATAVPDALVLDAPVLAALVLDEDEELPHAASTSGAMAAPRASTPAWRNRERRLSEEGMTGLGADICELLRIEQQFVYDRLPLVFVPAMRESYGRGVSRMSRFGEL